MKLKIAFLGFGKSTTRYHLPYVLCRDNMEAVMIYNRKRKPELEKNYTDYSMKFTDDLNEVLNNKEIELVSVCTPLATHYELAKKCLEAGKNVLVEKPFTSTLEEAKELFELAKQKKLVIMPYQNRRFDSDYLILKEIIKEGNLGKIVELESHFDRFRPNDPVQDGKVQDGSFWGLGSHLIDQMISLFGKPKKIYYDVKNMMGKKAVDDYFQVELFYEDFKAIVKSSHLVKLEYPKFIVHGINGSFIKYGIDKQEECLKNGMLPDETGFGLDTVENYGVIDYTDASGDEREEVRVTPLGDYGRIYDNLYEAIKNSKEKLIKDEEALLLLEILEAGTKGENPRVINFK